MTGRNDWPRPVPGLPWGTSRSVVCRSTRRFSDVQENCGEFCLCFSQMDLRTGSIAQRLVPRGMFDSSSGTGHFRCRCNPRGLRLYPGLRLCGGQLSR